MKKFDEWNNVKKTIDNNISKFYKERDVWWSYVGVNIGNEQDGDKNTFQRPVLVLRGISRNTCFVIPLTTSKREHLSRINIGIVGDKDAKAIMSQVKIIDTRRLISKICMIDKNIFENIRKNIKEYL